MNAKTSVFVICTEGIIYLLSYNLPLRWKNKCSLPLTKIRSSCNQVQNHE